jgi:hypothetical protein
MSDKPNAQDELDRLESIRATLLTAKEAIEDHIAQIEYHKERSLITKMKVSETPVEPETPAQPTNRFMGFGATWRK